MNRNARDIRAALTRRAIRPARPLLVAVALICFAPAAFAGDRHKELAGTVTIRRDKWGVPHILAETEEGAALGMGYVQFEDYPELLPELMLNAKGEAAKHLGVARYRHDHNVKMLGFYEDSVARFGELRPDIQAALEAYAAGYNMALEKYAGPKKPWHLPITAPQVLAYGRVVVVMDFTMTANMFTSLPKENDDEGEEVAMAVGDDNDMFGSNMWGIGGGRTASGRGILMTNPHLAWSGSQTFYEAHITVPGEMNVSGCTLIGNPGVTIGFNEHLGWGHTVNRFDSHDVFEIEIDPKDPDRYIYEGNSYPFSARTITVEVLGRSGEIEERSEVVRYTHHGPMHLERDGRVFAIRSPNLDVINTFEMYRMMNKARNLEEFKDALDLMGNPMFNIAYADRDGNSFYIFNGRIPQRPHGDYDWAGIVPGNTSDTDWSVVHPVSELPQLTNPRGDYVQNCNDSPWYTNVQQIIDKSLYPRYMSNDQLNLRTMNSLEMLEADESFTLEEVKELKNSTRMLAAERMKSDLIEVIRGSSEASEEMKKAAAILAAWDNHANHDSTGAVLFGEWFNIYRSRSKPTWRVAWDRNDPLATPQGVGDAEAALRALDRAISALMKDYGRLDIPWGEVHRLKRGGKSFPLAGGAGQQGFFRVLAFQDAPKNEAAFPGERVAVGGDTYVLAVEFKDVPEAWTIVAYGQTERADSPHHTDQSEMFARHEWKRAWFTEADVKANTARSYHPGE